MGGRTEEAKNKCGNLIDGIETTRGPSPVAKGPSIEKYYMALEILNGSLK